MSALLRSVSYYEDIPESFHAPPMSSIVALTPQYSDLLQCHIWKVQCSVATGSDKQVGLLFLFFTRCAQHNATLYGLFCLQTRLLRMGRIKRNRIYQPASDVAPLATTVGHRLDDCIDVFFLYTGVRQRRIIEWGLCKNSGV